jgi:hypothetical protein
VTTRWWLWTAVGVVVVGAGLGAGLGVGLSTPQNAPVPSSGLGSMTLSWGAPSGAQ